MALNLPVMAISGAAAIVCVGMLAAPIGPGSALAAEANGRVELAVAQPIDAYRLGPLDKVRIRAFEWRASRDEVYDWKAINSDSYTIGAGGLLSVPLIGQVRASGLQTAELAKVIGERLKQRLGLVEAPDVSVEVTNFRPFYIVGDIQKPGEYEYRPGLSILQSISLAGGLLRTEEGAAARVRRDLITTQGDLNVFDNEHRVLLVRKARLEAEMTNMAELPVPVELQARNADPAVAALIQQEQIFFHTRKKSYDSQITALEKLRAFLEKETASLGAQLKTHQRQTQLVQQELDSISGLYKKGLSIAPRKLGLERNVAQLDGERIKLEMELARANQEVSKISISIADLRNRRLNEVSAELQLTQTRLAEIGQRTQTAQHLLRETTASTPRLLLISNDPTGRSSIKYTIVRSVGGQATEIAATESTELMPGDSVKVDYDIKPGLGIDVNFASDNGRAPGRQAPEKAQQEQPHLLGRAQLTSTQEFGQRKRY
jgi:polysaccharide export outer membrane protein/exopolysaccharide production protein ExoF